MIWYVSTMSSGSMISEKSGTETELCEAAEKLDEETDVISAFHQLQTCIRNGGK